MMLLLSLLGLFASLTIANIERSCNCIDDACVNARGKPPYNTSCIVTVPVDGSDTDNNDTGYAYQACDNASYTDMSGLSDDGVHPLQANISNCIMLLEAALNPSTHSFVFLASQLYNNSEVPIAFHGDCYLWLLGGANATADLTDVNDNFFVGDMDLTLAVGNSIINYAHDSDANSQMAVCGTIPNCGFYNTHTASFSTAPDFAFCLGGEYIIAYWIEGHGSFGHDMVKLEDLPSEQVRMSYDVRSQATVPESADRKLSIGDESADLMDSSVLEPRARNWYLRCDPGQRSLAECTTMFDTFCDSSGRLHSDDVICRFDCSCMRISNSRCGLHYGFIYDCYDEVPDDNDGKMGGALIDALKLPSVSAQNSSTTAEDDS